MTRQPLFRIVVPGTPQQQGSKRVVRGRAIEANKNLASWRADALQLMRAELTRATADPDHPLTGYPIFDPVQVGVTFVYARPAAHFRTGRNASLLRSGAPTYKASAPDLDKLCRAVGDALTQSGAIRDDALIVSWNASKRWGYQPLAIIEVERVTL